MNTNSSRPRQWRRLLGVTAVFVTAIAVAPMFAGVAGAVHSYTTASVDCSGTISWNTRAWDDGSAGRNPDIRVFMDPDNGPEAQIAAGQFTADNANSLSGTAAWPAGAASVEIITREFAPYANGYNSPDSSQTVFAPTDCGSSPDVDVSTECEFSSPGNGTGDVALTLSAVGTFASSIDFRVYAIDQTSGSYTSYTVAVGTPAVHHYTGVGDGPHTYRVAYNSGLGWLFVDGNLQVDCNSPQPSASVSQECSDGDGSVTVTLTNAGGEQVTFTVTTPSGATEQHTVGANSNKVVTYSGLGDGQYSVTVKVGDEVITAQDITVDCDHALPSADVDLSCDAASHDGKIVVTMSNTGTESVTFTIVDPVTSVSEDVVVGPGGSVTRTYMNLSDGPHSLTLTAPGYDFSTSFTVNCDEPSQVSHSSSCVDLDGTVTLSLTNNGDDVAVTFTVNGTPVVVQPGDTEEHVISGLSDGPHSISLAINGVPQPAVSVEVDCDPTPTVEAECNTVEVDGDVALYWFSVTNGEAVPVTFTIGGEDVTLAAGASTTVSSATAPLVVFHDGVEVATAAATSVVCEREVTFEKVLQGQPPTGETYTIRVSRLLDNASYAEEVTFDLNVGQPVTINLPSTLDPSGIQYLIEEIDAGTAVISEVSPSDLQLAGHLGETVSVVVTNGYASVEIIKQALTGTVQAGGTITYTLQALNTGGLTLDPVVIFDRLPPQTELQSVSVQDGAGLCSLTESTRPQLVTCVMDDALPVAGYTKVITLVVKVDAGVAPGTQILNQAKVLGTWDTPELDGVRHPQQNADLHASSDLSCEPVEQGTVCDLSAKVGVPVGEGGQGGPTTIATTTTIRRGLPETGGGSGAPVMLLAGAIMAAAGAVLLAVRRRPAGR